jgi:hypothetical protein
MSVYRIYFMDLHKVVHFKTLRIETTSEPDSNIPVVNTFHVLPHAPTGTPLRPSAPGGLTPQYGNQLLHSV